MPAWKQGHAQIFDLSTNFAARKKTKVLGTPPGLPYQQVNTLKALKAPQWAQELATEFASLE